LPLEPAQPMCNDDTCSSPKRARREELAKADQALAESRKAAGHDRVLGCAGEDQLLVREKLAPRRKVRALEIEGQQLGPVLLAIAPQRTVEAVLDHESFARGVDEPASRLEGPATADGPERVGGHRR